jgi:hypothetical protein
MQEPLLYVEIAPTVLGIALAKMDLKAIVVVLDNVWDGTIINYFSVPKVRKAPGG